MKINTVFCPLMRIVLAFFIMLSFGSGAYALAIKEISSRGGVKGWLVEDRSVPVVAVRFSFKGGDVQDPAGKSGLAELMSSLLDEGAGNLSSRAFQARMDDLGADVSFWSTSDVIGGSLRVLAENRTAAVALLAQAVQKPRFDEDAFNRVREQMVVGLHSVAKNPETIAQRKFATMIYGKHPYANWTTPETLGKITRNDLRIAHGKLFARDNVTVAIVGALTQQEAEKILTGLFDALPQKAQLQPVAPVKLHLNGLSTVPYDMPQTAITLIYPGVARSDPQYYAAYLMSYTLGGPGLTSRLFAQVREKQGLAYGINSSLVNKDYASMLAINTATRAEQAKNSLKTIRSEVRKMVDEGISAEELAEAKSYVIGAYAVRNMRSSTGIAATLVGLQEQHLPMDYIERRPDFINAVTLDQVNAIAKKLLGAEPAISMVGPVKD